MTTTLALRNPEGVNPLAVRAIMGTKEWKPPYRMPGVGRDGALGYSWVLDRKAWCREATCLGDHPGGRILLSVDPWPDRRTGELVPWIHASMSMMDDHGKGRVPTYYELKRLHQAVFGDRWAYHVFAPPTEHVNLHEHVLHLWGRVDGKPELPDFAEFGGV